MKRLPHETVLRHRLFSATITVALVQPTILVLFLLASLALTGGQVVRAKGPIYGQVMPFPVVALPGWVLVVLAVAVLVLVIAFCVRAQLLDGRLLTGLMGPVFGSVITALFFLFAQTVEGDTWFEIALWVDAAAAALLVIMVLRFGPEYDRRLRSGSLPDGYA